MSIDKRPTVGPSRYSPCKSPSGPPLCSRALYAVMDLQDLGGYPLMLLYTGTTETALTSGRSMVSSASGVASSHLMSNCTRQPDGMKDVVSVVLDRTHEVCKNNEVVQLLGYCDMACSEQDDAPVDENLPLGQALQSEGRDAPVTSEYVLLGQFWHTEDDPYFPTGQSTQVPVPKYIPAGHVQSVKDVEAEGDDDLEGQLLHGTDDPLSSWYVPGGQSMHGVPE